MPSLKAIRSHQLAGTAAGIADALAEIDKAAIPMANLIFFI